MKQRESLRGRLTIGAVGLLATGLALAGCSAGTAPSVDADAEPIQLGVVLDITGVLASTSEPALNALNLAVEQVNADGGVDGSPIELLVEDSTSDPAVAAAAARTLGNKVEVVFGPSTGGSCRAVQPILDSAEVLQYCLSPQSFDLTPNFFWSLAPIMHYPGATAEWVRDIGAKRIAFIGQDDASGDGYLSLISAMVKMNPGEFEIVAEQRFGGGATNLETQMTLIRDSNPDVIFAGTSGGNIVPIARAAKALGLDQPIWVGTGSASVDALSPLANDLPNGGLITNAFWIDVADEIPGDLEYGDQVTAFNEAYQAEFGTAPGALAAGAYDAFQQVIAALRDGATTGPEIAKFIEGNSFTGVLGEYEMSADQHQGASLPSVMMRFTEDSKFVLEFGG